jgi:hypothetical protein
MSYRDIEMSELLSEEKNAILRAVLIAAVVMVAK